MNKHSPILNNSLNITGKVFPNHFLFAKDKFDSYFKTDEDDISLNITDKGKDYISVTYIPTSDQIIIKTPYEVYEGPLKFLSFEDAKER